MYKMNVNIKSIVEVFIESNEYVSSKEKRYLEALNNVYVGLFKVNKVDFNRAYVYLEDVVNGNTFKVVLFC